MTTRDTVKNLLIFGLLALGVALPASAQISPSPTGASNSNSFNGYLAKEAGLTYNNNYALDLSNYDASKFSANVLYSSVTFATLTLQDGAQSVGSFQVKSYTALSSASATAQFTVVSTSAISGAVLTIYNTQLVNGYDWITGTTKQGTAASIAAAINLSVPNVSASAASGIVYATATAGSYANGYNFSSNNSSVTASSAYMLGGQDNAVVTINGVKLTQGVSFNAVTSNAQTATNLAAAIAGAGLGLSSVGSAAFAYSTSTLNGAQYNYTTVSSTPTALLASGAAMTGGFTSDFALNGQSFSSTTANGFTLALPVLYAKNQTPAIGGLTGGTTYYVTPTSAFAFKLALYSTSSVAGIPSRDFVTITATNTQTAQDNYTLAPLAIAGTPGFAWQSSNDNVNWSQIYGVSYPTGVIAASSVTISAYASPPANAPFDFGFYNYRYIRLSVTAPTAGALFIQAPVNIKQDGIGRF